MDLILYLFELLFFSLVWSWIILVKREIKKYRKLYKIVIEYDFITYKRDDWNPSIRNDWNFMYDNQNSRRTIREYELQLNFNTMKASIDYKSKEEVSYTWYEMRKKKILSTMIQLVQPWTQMTS